MRHSLWLADLEFCPAKLQKLESYHAIKVIQLESSQWEHRRGTPQEETGFKWSLTL